MSTSTSATPVEDRAVRFIAGRSKRRFGLLIFLLALVVIALVLTAAMFFLFSVSGEEFSPQTFERRRFSYIRLPFVNRQLTGIARTAIAAPVEERLLADQLITPRPKDQTWDCIVLHQGSASTYGDARILTDYLDANGQGDLRVWLDWTDKHPECAKVFWPVVMQTAEEGMYLIVPELFRAARGGKEADPTALADELKRVRLEGYRTAAEREEKLQHVGAAAEFYRRASNLSPNDAALQEAARRTAAEANTVKSGA